MIRKIYLDMDGVLADFDAMIKQIRGEDHKNRLPDEEFWELIESVPNFWTDLPLFPGAEQLIKTCKKLEVPIEILTAPSRVDLRCYEGKIKWVKKHGFDLDVNFAKPHYKQKYAERHHLLIDDNIDNFIDWTINKGLAILHTDLESTLKEIEEYK